MNSKRNAGKNTVNEHSWGPKLNVFQIYLNILVLTTLPFLLLMILQI